MNKGLLFNFLPSIIVLVLMPVNLLAKANMVLPLTLYPVVEVLVMPIYLLCINYSQIKSEDIYTDYPFFMMVLSVILTVLFHYCTWGLMTNKFYNPDDATVHIMLLILGVNLGAFTVIWPILSLRNEQ